MMEGAYNKVLKARADVPSPFYGYFMNLLMDTVRDEIADGLEKAYDSLLLSDAQRMLDFPKPGDLKVYAAQRNWPVSVVSAGEQVSFQQRSDTQDDLSSLKLIKQTLHYAREMERIV